MKIKDLPKSDRPREKLIAKGEREMGKVDIFGTFDTGVRLTKLI